MYFAHIGSQDTKLCNLDFLPYVPQTDFYVSMYRMISSCFNSVVIFDFCCLKNFVKHKQVKTIYNLIN